MKILKKNILVIILINILIIYGCEVSNQSSSSNNSTFNLNFSQVFPELGDSKYSYYFWLNVNGNFKKIKSFKASEVNKGTSLSLSIDKTILVAATSGVVSIEKTDTATKPSKTLILKGDFVNNQLNMTFESANSLNGDLKNLVSGSYTNEVATSVNGDGISCSTCGVWFYTTVNNVKTPGLVLPVISGWKYEAWVKDSKSNQYISLGKFSLPNQSDLENKYGGNGVIPSFPGNDFVTGSHPKGITIPYDLSSIELSVTIEPQDADVEDTRFEYELLVGNISPGKKEGELGKGINVSSKLITASGKRTDL